jgi:hypothetical protein
MKKPAGELLHDISTTFDTGTITSGKTSKNDSQHVTREVHVSRLTTALGKIQS